MSKYIERWKYIICIQHPVTYQCDSVIRIIPGILTIYFIYFIYYWLWYTKKKNTSTFRVSYSNICCSTKFMLNYIFDTWNKDSDNNNVLFYREPRFSTNFISIFSIIACFITHLNEDFMLKCCPPITDTIKRINFILAFKCTRCYKLFFGFSLH